MRATMPEFPLTIGSILRHGTTVHGDSEAVTATAGGVRRIPYAELGRRAAQLAGALRRLGVAGDQRVATFGWNNQEHLEAYLAVPSMGAVLHTLNIRLFAEQIVYTANAAEDRVVIVDGSLVEALGAVLPELRTVRAVLVTGDADPAPLAARRVEVVSYDEALGAESEEFAWPDLDEHSAAAMCFTSGTTGHPKGVVYSHRSTYLHSAAVCSGNVAGLTFRDRTLPVVPMFHVNAWGLPYAAVMAGASLVLPDRFLQPEPLVRLIERERPTVSGAVPTIWSGVLGHLDQYGGDVGSLRVVLCGGAAVPRSLMDGFARHGVLICQAWGMTETSPVGSVALPPAGVPPEREMAYRTTAGRVVCGVEARAVADDGTVLAADGESVGEIEVRGPWVTASYYPEDDPARFDGRWLRTGDVGMVDPLGYLTLTDRAKDVIKSGGEWISSVELENLLMGHPEVAEAAVVGVPDERWSERPLAAVVLREGATADAEALRGYLGDRVAAWQLPERWCFVPAVPKTSVGKFDKKVIRRQYAEGQLPVQTLAPLGP